MNNYPEKLTENIPSPFFVLAPMDDVTDTVFRQIIAELAPPDLYFTEFVNADGLQSPGRPKLLKKLQFTDKEHPIIAQLWGKNPDNYYKTAQELVEMGFDGVDINMGCPVKTVVKNGCCSALINNQALAGEIIDACKNGLAGRVPLSVKTRVGFNEVNMEWIEFLLSKKIDMLTVHGRTAKEQSAVDAHWDLIENASKMRDIMAPETLIVGNGDVRDRSHGLELAERHGLNGIMIGRGIFHDPFAFAERSLWTSWTREQKTGLYARHVSLFADTWKNGEHPIHVLNKFCKIYINGFDGAKEMREELMQCTHTAELLLKLQGRLT